MIRVLRRFRTKIMWVRSCIIAPPFIDGWIFVCKLLPIIIGAVIYSGDGSDCVCTGGINPPAALSRTDQTAEESG